MNSASTIARLALALTLTAAAASGGLQPLPQQPSAPQPSVPPSSPQALMPRADLTGLSAAEQAELFEVANDVVCYAGCADTLARCLAANRKDPHAPRMAKLAVLFIQRHQPKDQVVQALERYYASFEKQAATIDEKDCALRGAKKPQLTLVEYFDFLCPHCAHASEPIQALLTKEKGLQLCAKHHPWPHPRAALIAACAEYARQHGKFFEFEERAFAQQNQLDDATLTAAGTGAGLDGAEMLKQAYAGKFDAVVDRQRKEGEKAGLDETPALYIDGRLLLVPPELPFLEHAVQDAREWKKHKGWAASLDKPAKARPAN